MHQKIGDGYLGDIDSKQLSIMMLSLTNINKYVSSIPEIVGGGYCSKSECIN